MVTPTTPKWHPTVSPLTTTERELFVKARALIDTPMAHFQGAYACSDTGFLVDPTDPRACRFCGIGALLAAAGVDSALDAPVNSLISRLAAVTERLLDDDRVAFPHVNDGKVSFLQYPEEMQSMTSHERVLYIYDEVLK